MQKDNYLELAIEVLNFRRITKGLQIPQCMFCNILYFKKQILCRLSCENTGKKT